MISSFLKSTSNVAKLIRSLSKEVNIWLANFYLDDPEMMMPWFFATKATTKQIQLVTILSTLPTTWKVGSVRRRMPNKENNVFLLELNLIRAGFLSPPQVYTPEAFQKSIESIFIWSYKNDFVLWTAGSLCEWKHKTVDKWADSETFEDYMKTLILECETNLERPANMTWTVPMDAPNTLYYQVLNLYPF